MIHRSKIDESQKRLVPFLRAHGASFESMAPLGKRAPDGVLGYLGVDQLVEFKTDKAMPTAGQIEWHRSWRGRPVVVLRTEADCTALLERMRAASRALAAAGLLRAA